MVLSFYNKTTNKFTGAQADESLEIRDKHLDINQGALYHDESFSIIEDTNIKNEYNKQSVLLSASNYIQIINSWKNEIRLLNEAAIANADDENSPQLIELVTTSEPIYKTLTPEQIAEGEAQYAKLLRNFNEENLTVTSSNGNVFDADKTARQNIADAILASDSTGITNVTWRLANNTEVSVDITELKEVQVLALKAYANLIGIS